MHTGGKLGVMIETNCETDFVAKCDDFAEMTKNIAMQLAASPNIEYVRIEDISEEERSKLRELEMQSEDLKKKPEKIRMKMIEGRMGKIFKKQVLLEQPYMKDPSITIDQYIKSYVAKLGENLKVSRFIRYSLGE
mmetsp:Transcript_47847/g.61344  ORF Transcript_47847/g.61344 Transcript_47847/m.61344 type:complete len:135 (-) Transcript_47847:123-527(-)